MRSAIPTYDVLVVGAGPGGLATAISAVRHGARVLVVERHPGTSTHPRASGISTRTMEIFRTWGVEDAVRARSVGVAHVAAAGPTLREASPTPTGFPTLRAALAVSPAAPACCPQDLVEPVLVQRLRRDGGEIRFSTELTELDVGPAGVHATLADLVSGTSRRVRARYVVGADGTRSTVRAALGIGVEYLGTMGEFAQVVFRADLDGVLPGVVRHPLYNIQHPEAAGLILAFGPDRWGYARRWFPENGESPADFTAARWTQLLRAATAVPDLEPEIESAATFTLAAEMATAFRAGPGFLVGDAAHRTTPVGAVGSNTAVHDGHNLGWKLAWAARGLAGEPLLESYVQERHPVGLRNTVRSLRVGETDPADGLPGDLGSIYRSGVLMADDGSPSVGYADPGLASAAPGERAPHVWVGHAGRRRSTFDLFEGRLTLLTGRRADGWREAAARLAATGLPVAALSVGRELVDPDRRLERAYRIGHAGAVLIRPDGYVAWRSDGRVADPIIALDRAVGTALGRRPVDDALAG